MILADLVARGVVPAAAASGTAHGRRHRAGLQECMASQGTSTNLPPRGCPAGPPGRRPRGLLPEARADRGSAVTCRAFRLPRDASAGPGISRTAARRRPGPWGCRVRPGEARDQLHRVRRRTDLPAVAAHEEGVLEAGEVVGRELATDPDALRDPRDPRPGISDHHEEDAEPEVPVAPVLHEELVPIGRGRGSLRIIAASTVRLFQPHEAVPHEDLEVVCRRPEREAEGPGDRSEMVSGEAEEVLVDVPTGRMVEAHAPK